MLSAPSPSSGPVLQYILSVLDGKPVPTQYMPWCPLSCRACCPLSWRIKRMYCDVLRLTSPRFCLVLHCLCCVTPHVALFCISHVLLLNNRSVFCFDWSCHPCVLICCADPTIYIAQSVLYPPSLNFVASSCFLFHIHWMDMLCLAVIS